MYLDKIYQPSDAHTHTHSKHFKRDEILVEIYQSILALAASETEHAPQVNRQYHGQFEEKKRLSQDSIWDRIHRHSIPVFGGLTVYLFIFSLLFAFMQTQTHVVDVVDIVVVVVVALFLIHSILRAAVNSNIILNCLIETFSICVETA